ncbi:transposase [Mesorhizobium sp. M0134]|uniref:IS110 family transposase n=1 Tax=Mesorhizobium sp. M0134 TaxID=2956889 RepID=UPI00333644B7
MGIRVYAGLDTSLDAVAICVIAETGEMLWQGKVLGDPDAVTAALQRWRDDLVRVGLEAGATSEWIGGYPVDEGFPVVCLESRHVKAALGAMTVKTDRNDAQGIAQIVRTGWFKALLARGCARSPPRARLASGRSLPTSRSSEACCVPWG